MCYFWIQIKGCGEEFLAGNLLRHVTDQASFPKLDKLLMQHWAKHHSWSSGHLALWHTLCSLYTLEPSTPLTDADRLLDLVLGDHVHANPSTHLSGDISNDLEWQTFLSHLIVYPSQQYDLPKGSVGKCFLAGLVTLLDMVLQHKCNSEHFLLYQMVILQQSPNVKSSSDICRHLLWPMDAWDAGKYSMLVQATEQDMAYFLTTHQNGTTSAQWHQTFHCKVLCGEVHSVVHYLLATEKG